MNYFKIYNQIIDRARERELEDYSERHHVIPKSLGGNDSKENLVYLTAKEHYLVHFLLTRMFPQSTEMIYAFWMMCNGSKKGRPNTNAKMYEVAREMFSQLITGRIGPNLGRQMSQETKDKISESKKGSDYWTGRKHSEESKKKQSKSAKNRKISEENENLRRKGISESNKKPKTEDHKNNIAESKKGNKNPMFGTKWKLVDGKRQYYVP